MIKRRLIAVFAAIVFALSLGGGAKAAEERAYIEVLAQYYAQYYDVPLELVRRVINRESTFNPRARNGPYWGLMQILPATARTMGFRGTPQELLDAETNLIYAVRYLRGAWLLANGSHDRAVQLYAAGYYYAARDAGMLEHTGLRAGPNNPPLAPRPGQAAVPPPPPPPQPVPDTAASFEPVIVASVAPIAAAAAEEPQAPRVTPLGFLPPQRPAISEPESAALAAIAEAAAPQPPAGDGPDALAYRIRSASAYMGSEAGSSLRPSVDFFEDTFSLLEAMASVIPNR